MTQHYQANINQLPQYAHFCVESIYLQVTSLAVPVRTCGSSRLGKTSSTSQELPRTAARSVAPRSEYEYDVVPTSGE